MIEQIEVSNESYIWKTGQSNLQMIITMYKTQALEANNHSRKL